MIKMRWKLGLFFILLVLIFFTANVKADSCINTNLARIIYLPQETVQVEIDADTIRDIFTSDIVLYRANVRIPIDIFLSKITETKYFAWFDLPSTTGEYILSVKGICKDSQIYISSREIEVKKTIASVYKNFEPKVREQWYSLSLKEHILSAGALSHTNLSSDALESYIQRTDSCLNTNCNTKLNSLSYLAFEYPLIRQKMLDAIEASQNYIKGNWKIKITSNQAQTCILNLDETHETLSLSSGTNTFDLQLGGFWNKSEIAIILDCENTNAISSILNYSYKNFNKEFEMLEWEDKKRYLINNAGCWGSGLRTDCDSESTTYALLSLAMIQKQNFDLNDIKYATAISWLKENAINFEEKALVYYLTQNYTMLEEILGYQSSLGWWPKNLELYQPDVETTSIILFTLKNSVINQTPEGISNSIEKAEFWLLNQNLNLYKEAFMLVFAFQSKEIEPLLAFWPGVIKTQSSGTFNLILLNRGTTNIVLNTELLNSTTIIELPFDSTKNLIVNIPKVTTIDGRTISEEFIINYKSKIGSESSEEHSYNIPVLIFTEKSSQEGINGTIDTSEQEVNETEQQEIVNETQTEWENKTTELNESLIQKKFKFIEKNITKSVNLNDGRFTISIRLENNLDKEVRDITLTHTFSFSGGFVERINPSSIDKLARGEKETIKIQLFPLTEGIYEGNIVAEGKYDSRDVSTNIPLIINVISYEEEENCSELGGIICAGENMICEGNTVIAEDTFACCIPPEKCEKKETPGRNIAIIIVLVLAAILIIILLILKRKPKKEMKEFLKEATKQYERRFQRPSSIRR